MSGIAGIVNLDGSPVQLQETQRMVTALARRGPDGRGVWQEGNVGLGHTLLWNTPEARFEQMPYVDPSGHWVIVTDARIDNRSELINILRLQPDGPEPITDGQIILAAYIAWGEACPNRLLGDFAFAIWDRRQQTLFCARDHFGIKPFYYHHAKDCFVFASAPSAILATQKVPMRLNEGRIADYLVDRLEGVDKTSTFYEALFRLPPAHILIIRHAYVHKKCYWSPAPGNELHLKSNNEYTEAFRELFTEAICCRLRSVSPPASMLSGGMDSSAIVAIAQQLLTSTAQPLHTFSAVSTNVADCIETQQIQAVLGLGSFVSTMISHEQLPAFADELFTSFRNAEDLFDASIPLISSLYLAAHRQGIKMLLDGLDGDGVISHHNYIAYLLQTGRWCAAYREIFHTDGVYSHYYRPWAMFYQQSRVAFMPKWLRRLRQRNRNVNPLIRVYEETLINSDFAAHIHLTERLAQLATYGYDGSAAKLRDAHVNYLNHPYLTVGLERYERVAAANAVEARHPLLDKRLVEFCLALPWHQRVWHGWTKVVLRRVVDTSLPATVVWRKDKAHLGWSFTTTLLRDWQSFVQQVIQDGMAAMRIYIDTVALQQACRNFFIQGKTEDGEKVWTAFTFALWIQFKTSSL